MSKHLWEIDHPYYCNEGCFYTPGTRFHEVHQEIASWADFMDSWADADEDYNFLFRWDWKRSDPADYEWEREENPAFELPGDTLQLFYMLQRKAKPMSVFVKVNEEDEAAVTEFLRGKAEYMRKIWEPLLDRTKALA